MTGWGEGVHEFIISVAVHPSVIPCSCRSRHINQNQKHCRGNRHTVYGEGRGVFLSVFERRKERRETGNSVKPRRTQPPPGRVIQVETAIRVSTRESTWKSETD